MVCIGTDSTNEQSGVSRENRWYFLQEKEKIFGNFRGHPHSITIDLRRTVYREFFAGCNSLFQKIRPEESDAHPVRHNHVHLTDLAGEAGAGFRRAPHRNNVYKGKLNVDMSVRK